jgi:hypothetical protein
VWFFSLLTRVTFDLTLVLILVLIESCFDTGREGSPNYSDSDSNMSDAYLASTSCISGSVLNSVLNSLEVFQLQLVIFKISLTLSYFSSSLNLFSIEKED